MRLCRFSFHLLEKTLSQSRHCNPSLSLVGDICCCITCDVPGSRYCVVSIHATSPEGPTGSPKECAPRSWLKLLFPEVWAISPSKLPHDTYGEENKCGLNKVLLWLKNQGCAKYKEKEVLKHIKITIDRGGTLSSLMYSTACSSVHLFHVRQDWVSRKRLMKMLLTVWFLINL